MENNTKKEVTGQKKVDKVKILNRGLLITGIVVLVMLISFLVMHSLQFKVANYDGKLYFKKGMNLEYVEKLIADKPVILKEGDKETKFQVKDLCDTYELVGMDAEQFRFKLFCNINKLEVGFETEKLSEKLSELNEGRTENVYAGIYLEDNQFVVKEEKQGDYLDVEKLATDIVSALDEDDVVFDLKDYYCKMDKTKIDAKELQKEVDKFNEFKIAYTNGYTLTSDLLVPYMKVQDNKIVPDETKADEFFKYVDKLIEKELLSYDTIGGTWDFTTHGGQQIQVTGGTWGDYFDSDKETEFVMDQLKTLESVSDREPVKSKDMEDTLPNTYLEVSLAEQHMWYYENGELKLESDVVTGTKGRMDTPVGVYFISEKIDGKYLRGPGYKTWVDKWMRITNQGHGFHDASWRGRFGGKIYTYDGSHGCINLPKKFAYTLFDTIKVNDCVVIY